MEHDLIAFARFKTWSKHFSLYLRVHGTARRTIKNLVSFYFSYKVFSVKLCVSITDCCLRWLSTFVDVSGLVDGLRIKNNNQPFRRHIIIIILSFVHLASTNHRINKSSYQKSIVQQWLTTTFGRFVPNLLVTRQSPINLCSSLVSVSPTLRSVSTTRPKTRRCYLVDFGIEVATASTPTLTNVKVGIAPTQRNYP